MSTKIVYWIICTIAAREVAAAFPALFDDLTIRIIGQHTAAVAKHFFSSGAYPEMGSGADTGEEVGIISIAHFWNIDQDRIAERRPLNTQP